jgi:hypothetical protein
MRAKKIRSQTAQTKPSEVPGLPFKRSCKKCPSSSRAECSSRYEQQAVLQQCAAIDTTADTTQSATPGNGGQLPATKTA